MDGQQVNSALSNIAYGQAMMAAIRDYKKDVLAEHATAKDTSMALDMDDMLDDPELQKLHEDRVLKLREEAEKRAQLERKGHGRYEEIQEGEFLEVATHTDDLVCHFFHRDFERCKIMDKHLKVLAQKYFNTRFVKLSAPDAPFFTVKLNVKTLPCLVLFKNGVVVNRVVGFEPMGGKDDFTTGRLENLLWQAGVLSGRRGKEASDGEEEEEEEEAIASTTIRRGVHCPLSSGDEDSDFD